MPHFLVMMHGVDIKVPNGEGGAPIVGFYTTRLVNASSSSAAESEALGMVVADWTAGEYAKSNQGSVPKLSVESVRPCGFFKRLRFKNTGHTFYTADEEDA